MAMALNKLYIKLATAELKRKRLGPFRDTATPHSEQTSLPTAAMQAAIAS
jgi:hypothetical protein